MRISLVITTLLFAMIACQDKNKTIFVFPKPIEKKLNATAICLSNEKNHYKKNYSKVFLKKRMILQTKK